MFKLKQEEQSENMVEQIEKSRKLLNMMKTRWSVRSFSNRSIPVEIITNCIAIAASATSGANMQPWYFVLVSDPEKKKRLEKGQKL